MESVRIVHISDLHIERGPTWRFGDVMPSLHRIAPVLQSEKPDLLVVSGDLTTSGSADPRELTLAREWLEHLGLPYLALAGNHDLGANPARGAQYPDLEHYEPVPFAETGFGRVFSANPVTVRSLGPVVVVGISVREDDPDGVLPALDQVLRETSRPVLLYGHYPLRPVRDQGVLAQFGSAGFIPRTGDALRTLLTGHPHVRLYGCGHVHAASLRPLSPGLQQMSAGGLGPGSSTYRRLTITGHDLAFELALGAGPLGFWERLIKDCDFGLEYHVGAPDERMGVLRLP